MKYPLKVLVGLYLFNVLAVGYLVYAFERANGTCTAYVDVVWMMGVTITNLGFGDFTPSFWMSRTIGKKTPRPSSDLITVIDMTFSVTSFVIWYFPNSFNCRSAL